MTEVTTEALQSKVNELTAELEQQKEISAGYQKETEALKGENESLAKQLEALLKGDRSAADEKSNGVGSEVEVDGTKYKILLASVNIPGFGKRTALELATDEEALRKLVSTGSGAIVAVA